MNIVTFDSHASIFIDGNSALDAFPDKTGYGNVTHPYIIQNYEINATGVFEAIEIRNTDRYVTIRNCTLFTENLALAVVYLHNVSYVTITNCTIKDSEQGIYVNESQYCTFWDNDIINNNDRGLYASYSAWLNITLNYFYYNSQYHIDTDYCNSTSITYNTFRTNFNRGLRVEDSLYTTIFNNTMSDSADEINVVDSEYTNVTNNIIYDGRFSARGILISSADHCTVVGNNITQHMTAINLYFSDNTTVRGNIAEYGGFRIDGLYYDMVLEDNTVFGKPIYYYSDKTGLGSMNFTNAAQIFLYNCSDSIISDLNITGVYSGIALYQGENNTIFNNSISANNYRGIEIINSDFNKLINNTVFDHNRLTSSEGIVVGSLSDNTTLSGNTVYDNSVGVELSWCNNATISANNISDNSQYNIYMDNAFQTTIVRNNISLARTYHGIYLDDSDKNIIALNNISYNDDYSVSVATTSADNLIYLNTFIVNNHPEAWYTASGSGNAFDNGSMGNYYSDYRYYHPAAGHNGTVWDNPYEINIIFDNHPLVSPYGLNWPAPPPIDPYGCIRIDGNTELDAFPNKTGLGTFASPYVIKDLVIDAYETGAPIDIRNTDKPLIIRNCTLSNSSAIRAGLYLVNVSHVTIHNCTMFDNQDGVYVNDSRNCTFWDNDIINSIDRGLYAGYSALLNITLNYFFNNFQNHIESYYSNSTSITSNFFRDNSNRGLWIRNSLYTYIFNNTMSDSPDEISVSGSDYTTVLNNTIYEGSFNARGVLISSADHCIVVGNNITQHRTTIQLFYADNTTVRDNTVEGGGFRIDGLYYYAVVENNTQDGKPIYYYRDENGLSADNFTNAAQIFLYNCRDSLISDQDISGTHTSIVIYAGQNNTILNNTLSSNYYNGIDLQQSDFNKIINNTIFDNKRLTSCAGITLSGAENTTLVGNHVYDNSIGIDISWSHNTSIIANNISDNTQYNIYLDNADKNTIAGNNVTLARTFHGIYLTASDQNLIARNNISYNDDNSVYVTGTSADNLIYLNIFIGNNHPQARYLASGSGNAFHNGSLGNYYGDYRTYYPTAGHNGVYWDQSYQIDSVYDNFPLVDPYGVNLSALAPILSPITPNPSNDGTINLNWSVVWQLPNYYVYRSSTEITSVTSLTPIASVTDTNYTDSHATNGIYYYVIVAGNSVANGSISNCENVTVAIPHNASTLDIILPNPDIDGFINLNWNNVSGATTYYVYRNLSTITSPTGLTPIAAVSDSNYTDNITANGIYFYAIVAGDSYVNGSISNCENVTVLIPLNKPVLQAITPNPDEDGIIVLDWNDIPRATIYYIYRETSNITSLTGLTPIDVVSNSSHVDTVPLSGSYYYVIVASDGWVNSTMSDCENVLVLAETDGGGGLEFIVILILGSLVAVYYWFSYRKRKIKAKKTKAKIESPKKSS